nr:nucleotide-binding alpha-beta plait domain-containing protein [Tanacetum cinerariifolium]
MVLGNEGFNDIDLRYMGGMWIMIGFKTKDTKAKFQSCLGATSWFSQIIQASKEFVIDERITWVDIEGIPLKLWSKSTFNRIAAKWGKMLYLEKLDEGCLYSKRLCILTTGKSNILETFKIIHKRKRFSVRAKETTRWISDFDEQKEDNSESKDEQSIEFECDKKSMGNNEGSGLTSKSKQLLRTVKLVVVLIPSMIVHPPLAKPRTYMLWEPIKFSIDMFHIDVPILYAFTNEIIANVDVLASSMKNWVPDK